VISGDAGSLLYAATFDGGGTDGFNANGFNADWSQYTGRLSAQISDGQARITIGEIGAGAYSVAEPYFADFDLRAEAQTVSGPLDNEYGVVFRLQDKDNDDFGDDSYYLFLISADGYYRVSRSVDGSLKIISDWIASPLINQGMNAVNRLRVLASGDRFRFWINEQPVTLCIPNDPNAESTINPLNGECMGGAMLETLIDATIPNGQVGVTARSTPTGGEGVVASFDNLLIYAPTSAETG
jgi:hypothetical protein